MRRFLFMRTPAVIQLACSCASWLNGTVPCCIFMEVTLQLVAQLTASWYSTMSSFTSHSNSAVDAAELGAQQLAVAADASPAERAHSRSVERRHARPGEEHAAPPRSSSAASDGASRVVAAAAAHRRARGDPCCWRARSARTAASQPVAACLSLSVIGRRAEAGGGALFESTDTLVPVPWKQRSGGTHTPGARYRYW